MIPDHHIISQFTDDIPVHPAQPFGSGHIHRTYLIELPGKKLILQQINTHVFTDPGKLMDNILAVTRHLEKKLVPSIQVLLTQRGKPWYVDPARECWRCYNFLEGYITYDRVPDPAYAFEGGRAIGDFIKGLMDLPAGAVFEVIPGFHDLPGRLLTFNRVVEQDSAGRRKTVAKEIRHLLDMADEMLLLPRLISKGAIPVRTVHNDTKINNTLFDASGKASCMIDLDTVMPGTALFDFGDAVRTYSNTAQEDEQDGSLVHFDRSIYLALLEGFLSSCSSILNEEEQKLLPFSARFMTYIMAVRFLTDFLAGDVYYQINHPTHNLIRARNQMELMKEM